MTASRGQYFFCGVHHAVKVTGDDTNYRFMPRLLVANTQKFEQGFDVVLVTVRVLTAETANRVFFTGFEVSGSRIQSIGMLMNPRTRNVMFA